MTGFQQILEKASSDSSSGGPQTDAMADLKAAGNLQRKLFMYMLAARDATQEATFQSVLLHLTELNTQKPWQLVQHVHEDMLVGVFVGW